MISKCPFCQSKQIKLKYSANKSDTDKKAFEFACTNCRYGIHGPIVECFNCGIIFVDDKITQNEISGFYQTLTDPLYLNEQKAREKTFNLYLDNFVKFTKKRGKLLDIGTNTGIFVKLAMDAGFDAVGLEPNLEAVEYAKKNYGLSLINKPFEKNTFPKNSFDVVTMWDVIEHFTDPIVELEKVYEVLRSGGVYAFSTVDPNSLVARFWGTKWAWYMEMHRVFLDRKTMERYLKQVGFSRVIFRPHWRYFSLGYASKLTGSIHPIFATIFQFCSKLFGISHLLIPYYANDLYDCYAFKD